MDNLSSHKVNGVRQRIEMCGAELLYLPPYSPDLTPIEKAWSKLIFSLTLFEKTPILLAFQQIHSQTNLLTTANQLNLFDF